MKLSFLIGTILTVTSINSFATCTTDADNIAYKSDYTNLEVISCDRTVDDNKNSLSADASICIKKYNRKTKNKHGKLYDVFVSGKLSDTILIDTDNSGKNFLNKKDMSYYSDSGFRGLTVRKGVMANYLKMHIHKNSSYMSVIKKKSHTKLSVDAIFSCTRTITKF